MTHESDFDKYAKRYIRKIHNYKWADKKGSKFNALNKAIFEKELLLKNKIAETASYFIKLQNEGFYFLNGFTLKGTLLLNKEILDEYGNLNDEELNKLSKQKKSSYRKWDNLRMKYQEDFWTIEYDSSVSELTPYSQQLLKEFNYADLIYGADKKDLYICSYIYSLVTMNNSITYEDICECTPDDFYLKLELETGLDEQRKIYSVPDVFYEYYGSLTPESILLQNRREYLNENFDWSDENIKKIMHVNEIVCRKENEAAANVKRIMERLKKDRIEDQTFCGRISVSGEIRFFNDSHANDIADIPMLRFLSFMSRTEGHSLYLTSYQNENAEVTGLYDDLNWNYEMFEYHFNDEQKKVRFSYYMHDIFVDGQSWSLEDLIRFNDDDIKILYEISF